MKAVDSIVRETADLVRGIRSGVMARNDEVRARLQERLTSLEQSLADAGRLAAVAEAYTRTNEKVVDLQAACRRVDRFLRDNMSALADGGSSYDADWRLLDTLFDAVSERRDVPRSAVLDRSEWYDVEDRAKIDMRLNHFSDAYARASVAINGKAARDTHTYVRTMIEALDDVETLLETTIYDKVLRTLQDLKR